MNTQYEAIYHMLVRACTQVEHIIAKAEDHVRSGAISESELLAASLAPDMFPFVRQIQIASDNIKGGAARLSGVEAPSMDDTETTLASLRERVKRTRAFLDTLSPSDLNKGENLQIRLRWMPERMHMSGHDYASYHLIQNTLFHVVTAYDILRMKGGAIGKSDYIGQISMHH
jgi:uncharacterized protein